MQCLPATHQCTNPATSAAEERFERELGQMVVDETCPRCGKAVSRGHRTHLMGCGGERPPRQPRPSDREELAVSKPGGGEGLFGCICFHVVC